VEEGLADGVEEGLVDGVEEGLVDEGECSMGGACSEGV